MKRIDETLFFGVLSVERLVLYFGVFAAALFWILDLTPRTRIDFYLKQIMMACDNYALGLMIAALLIITAQFRPGIMRENFVERLRRGWLQFIELFFSRRSICCDLRLIFAMLLTLAIFSHLKHLIPFVNGAVYDQVLVDQERWLFGGKIASEIVIQLLGVNAAPVMSWGYTAYYFYMNVIFMIFILQRDRWLGIEFCTAFALLWFLGALMIYLAPTWGPCFYLPEIFKALPNTPVTELQAQLWLQHQHLVAHPKSSEGIFLISGQPSLHIAVTVLGSIYLWRLWKPIAVISWGFVALTTITTLYLGWHYIADNILALSLVVGAIYIARKISNTGCGTLITC